MVASNPGCTVYYDGACPLCRREIAHYRKQTGGADIQWVDASRCAPAELGSGLSREAALARLHVRDASGRLVSGAAAFAALWQRLPAYAWLARIASSGPVLRSMDLAYDVFLRLRPLWRRGESSTAGLPAAVVADLRTDHAGETGAVRIYRGILAVSRDAAVRAFATRHLATESLHLALIERWLPSAERSRLLPVWRVAGWLTGALPALFGPRAVYATVAAVERFVDGHYADQVERMDGEPGLAALRDTLDACRRDEVAHRDEALEHLAGGGPGPLLRAWSALVGTGSALAVRAARRW